jgi:hypothetical protein
MRRNQSLQNQLTHKALKLNIQAKIRIRNKKFSKQHTSGMTSLNIHLYRLMRIVTISNDEICRFKFLKLKIFFRFQTNRPFAIIYNLDFQIFES